ncbi:MAG TPA: T9SS type A sorting domain-containing protein [Phnomibacter sp.]|nr:T9SS type A sorting domain-containing protein [Phnomibacter sp.]
MRKIYFLVIAVLLTAFCQLNAQTPQPNWPVAAGRINSIVRSGNTIYMGGGFNYVGPNVPYFASINATTGVAGTTMPKPNGLVNAVVPDGAGGWYIGGSFTQVGNAVRNRIARINADGTVNDWNPNADNTVSAIAVSGNTVYIGGAFTNVKGTVRGRIAAIDATTGDLTAWNPNASANVVGIAVNGSTIYTVGAFASIGGQTRNRIAALDATTGLATSWNPAANFSSGLVNCVAIAGNTVFVGSSIAASTVGGASRKYLYALDATTALATSWAPEPSSTVNALVVDGNTLYVGGGFTSFAGPITRNRIASFDISNPDNITLNNWDPNAGASGTIYSLAVSGSTVYVGGTHLTIGGQNRNRLAAIDASTGLATSWDPNVGGQVSALAVSGSSIYAGGNFVSIGGQTRNGLAAFDATSGALSNWNPNLSGGTATANAIIVNGSTVYFGGNFITVGSTTRNRAAAVDASTGVLTSWNPDFGNGFVNAMALNSANSQMFLGGSFTQANGTLPNRAGLAAVDLTNGTLNASWDANITGLSSNTSSVTALLLNGNTLYVGGVFNTAGGQTRNRIAALDATTAIPTAWNPDGGGGNTALWVYSLAMSGNTIYAGGTFTTMGGQLRNRIAAIDATTGLATSWNPNANALVNAIAVEDNTVYAGGDFTTIGGAPIRNRIAALDATTGVAETIWDPNAAAGGSFNTVSSFLIDGSNIFVGGTFTTMQNLPSPYLAVFQTVHSILPVKLLSFNARSISGTAPKVLCTWETAQEINFSRFIVERSSDGKNFNAIGTVMASNSAATHHQYSFTDNSPLAGTAFYRLKQVDMDGKHAYSKVVIILGQKDQAVAMLFPNPARDIATLMIALPAAEQVRYTVYDQNGKMMMAQSLYLKEGSQTISLAVQQLPAGVYTLVLRGAVTNKQLQLIKQ